MKVLTFGWEFPPSMSGGLGVACQGLTRELIRNGVDVLFVLPRRQTVMGEGSFRFADEVGQAAGVHTSINSSLQPYAQSDTMLDIIVGYDAAGQPIFERHTLLDEVQRFAARAKVIAKNEQFDLIHAHDWTSYLAGVAAKEASNKKLILHVHATSFDQAASNNVDPAIYKIECESFAKADRIFTVSDYTKEILITKHKVPADKIFTVHNGCETFTAEYLPPVLTTFKEQGRSIVLYHGRISIQKGVDYFVKAARRVVDVNDKVLFVISGSGDMSRQIIEQVGALGLSGHVLFAGPLWDKDRDRMYQAADLLVMPSVSEPFGLVPLEALQHGTPAVISKQSGVAEVLSHALKVDFWDVEEMANQILSALRYPVMRHQMVNEGREQVKTISWQRAATKIKELYHSLIHWLKHE